MKCAMSVKLAIPIVHDKHGQHDEQSLFLNIFFSEMIGTYLFILQIDVRKRLKIDHLCFSTAQADNFYKDKYTCCQVLFAP